MGKFIAAAIVLSAGFMRADEASDRTAIERTIAAVNEAGSEGAIRALATPEGYAELGPLLESGQKPWSEMSRPHFTVQKIRFITPDVALVDAAAAQYGSTILVRRFTVLVVMKKEENAWRIASARALGEGGR